MFRPTHKKSSSHVKTQNRNHTCVTYFLVVCETCLFLLKEKCTLREFGNEMLRRICGPKRDEVTRNLRILNNEELCDIYSTPNINRVIK